MLRTILRWLWNTIATPLLMTANWTTPATYTPSQRVGADDLNLVRDNLEFLKSPPTDTYEFNDGSNWSTTSTTFANVDATDLSLDITTAGGAVMIGFVGTVDGTSGGTVHAYFDVSIDGVRIGGDDGICVAHCGAEATVVSFVYLKVGVSAGAHNFKLMWKTSSGDTLLLYAGAGTSNYDVHGQFWVREVS